jgi:hypothetical protein
LSHYAKYISLASLTHFWFEPEGVQYEEKGEQQESTEQAREYYEKAGEMYSKAHELDDSDVDSLYNW